MTWTSEKKSQKVISIGKLDKKIHTFENFLFHILIDRPNLLLGLNQILQFDTIEEVEAVLDALESVPNGLLETLLAFYGLLFEFGYVFEEFLFHRYRESIVLG